MHIDHVKQVFKGELYTQWHNDLQVKFAKEHGLTAVQGRHEGGLGKNMLHFNSNSGAQAINLAYLLGASRIILLGFDIGNAPNGKAHWFGSHPKGLVDGVNTNLVGRFNKLAEDLKREGVEVINCSRRTNLTQFKRIAIEQLALS